MTSRGSKLFVAVSWLPLAFLLWTLSAMSRAEGWGAWAIPGAVFPVILTASGLMTLTGILLWIYERRRRNAAPWVLLAAVLAAVPSLWIGAKLLLR